MIQWIVRRLAADGDQARDPAVRQRCGMVSGGIGIALNLMLFLGKAAAGLLTGSIAITADAFNNLSDAGSSVVTLAGFRMAGRKADAQHPFGHGRMEYLAGLVVSMAIVVVGFELARTSLDKILHPQPPEFSLVSAVILAAAVCVKVWMYFFNRALGRRLDSAAMLATAADSLTDSVATTAVLAGTLIGRWSGVNLDGWLGILVSLFILYTGFQAARDTLDPLLGTPPAPQLVQQVHDAVLAHPEVSGLHDLVIHDYGPGRSMMSFHAEVDQDADLLHIHDVIDNIERELNRRFSIQTVIHMDPVATRDPRVLELKGKVEELARQLDERVSIHDFRITAGPLHTNLIFDMVLPHGLSMSDEAAVAWMQEKIAALQDGFYAVIEVDHPFL